jgi:hypothetical protein
MDDTKYTQGLIPPEGEIPELTWDELVRITTGPRVMRAYRITPAVAARILLERDQRNRKRTKARSIRHIEHLVSELRTGNWRFTGECVRFDSEGCLSDGGHRMEAINRSQVPASMKVLTGFDRSSQIVLDCARLPRTGTDALTLDGLEPTIAPAVAAIITEAVAFENKLAKRRLGPPTPKAQVAYYKTHSAAILRALYHARTIIGSHQINVKAKKTRPYFIESDLASLIYTAIQQNEPEATVVKFFNKMLDGHAEACSGENYPPFQAFLALCTDDNKAVDRTRSYGVLKSYRNSILSEAYHLFKLDRIARLKTKDAGTALCAWPFPVDGNAKKKTGADQTINGTVVNSTTEVRPRGRPRKFPPAA